MSLTVIFLPPLYSSINSIELFFSKIPFIRSGCPTFLQRLQQGENIFHHHRAIFDQNLNAEISQKGCTSG